MYESSYDFDESSFRLVLKEKTGKEIRGSSRLQFFKSFLVKNFALSDAEGNTFGKFTIGDISYLALLLPTLVQCKY